MDHPSLRSGVVALALAGSGGCLLDPDFFDPVGADGGTGGVHAPSGGTAPPADAFVRPEPDAEIPDAPLIASGPACDGATCASVELRGPDLRLAALVGDASGAAWALVNGRLEGIVDAGGARGGGGASSHLLRLASDDWRVTDVIALPFTGSDLAASEGGLWLSGTSAMAGRLFDRDFGPIAGRAVVACVVNDAVRFVFSYRDSALGYAPRVGATGDGSIVVSGAPGNADFYLDAGETPFRSGTDPTAPGAFLVKLDGAGGLVWERSIGDPTAGVRSLAVGPGGHVAFAAFANTALDLWGQGAGGPGVTLAGTGPDGSLSWTAAWAETDVDPRAFAVDGNGRTWVLAHIGGVSAMTTPWPAVAPAPDFGGAYGAVARILPDGTFDVSTTLHVPSRGAGTGLTLGAVAAGAGDDVTILGDTSGAAGGHTPLFIGGKAVVHSGPFVAGLDAGAAVWAQVFGRSGGNAPLDRHVRRAGPWIYVGGDLPGDVRWGERAHPPGAGARIVLLRVPGP